MYVVIFGVRPLPEHPYYWEMQGAYLKMFLFAQSREDAGERAAEIVDNLPYERSKRAVISDEECALKLGDNICQARDEDCIQEAEWSGLALRLVAWEIGASEENLPSELRLAHD